jgi:hypothetical protein
MPGLQRTKEDKLECIKPFVDALIDANNNETIFGFGEQVVKNKITWGNGGCGSINRILREAKLISSDAKRGVVVFTESFYKRFRSKEEGADDTTIDTDKFANYLFKAIEKYDEEVAESRKAGKKKDKKKTNNQLEFDLQEDTRSFQQPIRQNRRKPFTPVVVEDSITMKPLPLFSNDVIADRYKQLRQAADLYTNQGKLIPTFITREMEELLSLEK